MPTEPTSPDFDEGDDLDNAPTLRGLRGGMKVFGRYQLIRKLGQGGMGVVWLAQDTKLDLDMALKFLPENLVHDEVALDDLRRETRRCMKLTHQHIVHVYDLVDDEDTAAIAMEHVDGKSFSALRLEQTGRVFEVSTLAPLLRQVCEGLAYAHQEGRVVHYDLKPGNLMVTASGQVKVMDFGIAASIHDSHSRQSRAGTSTAGMGTRHYMSPQQQAGYPPSVSDDVYSLGATVYELLTGKPPFHGFRDQALQEQINDAVPASMAVRRGDLGVESVEPIPEAWEEAIAACLEKDPAKRPAGVMECWKRMSEPKAAPPVKAEAPVRAEAAPVKAKKMATPKETAPAGPAVPELPPLVKRNHGWWIAAVPAVGVLASVVGGIWPVASMRFFDQGRLVDFGEDFSSVSDVVEKVLPFVGAMGLGMAGLCLLLGLLVASVGQWLALWPRLRSTGAVMKQAGLVVVPLCLVWVLAVVPPVFLVVMVEQTMMHAVLSRANEVASACCLVILAVGLVACVAAFKLGVHRIKGGTVREFAREHAFLGGPLRVLFRAHRQSVPVREEGSAPPLSWLQQSPLRLRQAGAALLMVPLVVTSYSCGVLGYRWLRETTLASANEARVERMRTLAQTERPLPEQATAEVPYLNGLGMMFVPVPITGGPSDGQKVLFSLWETRVKDMAASKSAPLVEDDSYGDQAVWIHKPEEMGEFCQWLTAKEQAGGRLPAGWRYRLPTDHEWSCAAGIGAQEDASSSAAAKSGVVPGYPWGDSWPPPYAAGNYDFKDFTGFFSLDSQGWSAIVGRFPPNALGLYDMGGNYSELCVDAGGTPALPRHVLRGGSSEVDEEEKARLSYRITEGVNSELDTGFRCVLARETTVGSAALKASPPKAAVTSEKTAVGNAKPATNIGKLEPALAAKALVYRDVVAPILQAKCVSCHGEEKKKGKLQLHTHAAIMTGGGDGATTVMPGNIKDSLLLVRINFPIEDDEHMPPSDEPQLTQEEAAVLKWWIETGASESATVASLKVPADVEAALAVLLAKGLPKSAAPPAKPKPLTEAEKQQVAEITTKMQALNASLMPVEPDSGQLRLSVINAADKFGDKELALLAPIAKHVVWLDLARCQITDASAETLVKMTNLERLHLENTAVTDAGIGKIATLPKLEYLNLYGTQVTDRGMARLSAAKGLKKLFVWQTAVTEAGAEALEAQVPGLKVNIEVAEGASSSPEEPIPEEAKPAVEALTQFLAATTMEERLRHTLGAETMRPLMERYYARASGGSGALPVDRVQFVRMDAKPELGSGRHCILSLESTQWEFPVPVMLEERADGFKVDWLTFMEFKDRLLEKFYQTYQEGTMEFHVGIQRQHYFEDGVPDLDRKDAFLIEAAPPNPFNAFAFLDKDSVLGADLRNRLNWESHVWAVVHLKWKKQGAQQWVELVGVPQMHWYPMSAAADLSPAGGDEKFKLAEARFAKGLSMRDAGKFDEALSTLIEAVKDMGSLVLGSTPRDLSQTLILAEAYTELADLCYKHFSYADAKDAHNQTLPILRELNQLRPQWADVKYLLARNYGGLASLARDYGNASEAAKQKQEAITLASEIVANDKTNPRYGFLLAKLQGEYAELQAEAPSTAAAGVTLAQQAVGSLEALLKAQVFGEPTIESRVWTSQLAQLYGVLGVASEATGKKPEAKAAFATATALWEKLAATWATDEAVKMGLTWSKGRLAKMQ